jgi:hypothetical protein
VAHTGYVDQIRQKLTPALESSRRQMAPVRLKMAFEQGLVEVGDKTWGCDELYERRGSGRE